MMTRAFVAALVALAFVAAPALAQSTPPPQPSNTPPSGQPKDQPSTIQADADQDFVRTVAEDGMAEIELGRLAQQKAKSEQVKQFAARMIADHSKANSELKQIADREHITLATQLAGPHAAMKRTLEGATGAAFDLAYMNAMVDDHKKAVNAFETEAKNGKDAAVKAFAQKTLPIIQQHLRMAEQLDQGPFGTSGKKD